MNERERVGGTRPPVAHSDPRMVERARNIAFMHAIAEAIHTAGAPGIRSGHLYAMLMGHMTLEQYQHYINTLVVTRLVTEQYHLLTWVGPETMPTLREFIHLV